MGLKIYRYIGSFSGKYTYILDLFLKHCMTIDFKENHTSHTCILHEF